MHEQQKWEYLLEEMHASFALGRGPEIEGRLAALGEQGWELVTVVPLETGLPLWIFKRPRREGEEG